MDVLKQLFNSVYSNNYKYVYEYVALVLLSKHFLIFVRKFNFCSRSSPEETLREAELKLQEIDANLWLKVAQELHGEDPYQFLRAYTHGRSPT